MSRQIIAYQSYPWNTYHQTLANRKQINQDPERRKEECENNDKKKEVSASYSRRSSACHTNDSKDLEK